MFALVWDYSCYTNNLKINLVISTKLLSLIFLMPLFLVFSVCSPERFQTHMGLRH